MKKSIIWLIASCFVGSGMFFSSVNAADSLYFSRANCALPQDVFRLGKTGTGLQPFRHTTYAV